MDDLFKLMFERELSEEKEGRKKAKENSGDYSASGEFNPSDSYYDPQTRLKRRLKQLFPHLPGTPGLPPR
jgi:hypothetical protein